MSNYVAKIHEITGGRPESESFCAALLQVPDFPDGKPAIKAIEDMGGKLLSVVGCNDNTGRWGYATLDDDEKCAIGDALMEHGAEIGRWYWCTLFDYGRYSA